MRETTPVRLRTPFRTHHVAIVAVPQMAFPCPARGATAEAKGPCVLSAAVGEAKLPGR